MVSARFVLPLMLSAAVRGEDTPDFADVADEEACEMQQTLLQVSKGVHKSRAASHTATVETVAGAYAQCPEKGHNGGCCHTCLTNRYCPADGGCYTAGDSRCPVELCPAPEDVPTPWYLKPGVFCGTSGLDVNGNKPADCSACHGMGECNGDCAYNPSGWCVPAAEAGVRCGERSAVEGTRYESCSVCHHMGQCNTDCAYNWNNWCVPIAEAGVQCGEESSLHGTRYESCALCSDFAECNTDCDWKWNSDGNRESCVPIAEAGVKCGEHSSIYGTRYESCGQCYDIAECNTDCAFKWDASFSRENCVPVEEAFVRCGDPRHGGKAESCGMCASLAECNTDCHYVNGGCVKKDMPPRHSWDFGPPPPEYS